MTATQISPDRALELVLAPAAPAASRPLPLDEAPGLVLGEPVAADRDYPPFDRAAMDGYAVCTADAGRRVPVVGVVNAGELGEARVERGRCVEIMTGAPCPTGTEAVVMKEEVAREGDRVLLPTAIAAGQHVARRGSECAAGATVLEPGSRLSPLAIAVLASFGRQRVLAIPAPSLAVITTGDELVATGSVPGSAQIRNSNGPMLIAQARRAGLGETLALHALDTAGSLAEALAAAADRDLVVLSGGVSAGGRDLVPRALEDAGAEIVLHRVKQKPGKPLLFAVRRRPSGNQLLFGLPGNPLSTHFCFHRYVLPAARKLMGRPPPHEAARARATLGEPLVARADRTLFLPLALARSDGGALAARALVGQGSADIFASWRAEAYLRLEPGEHRLEAGRELECELIGEP